MRLSSNWLNLPGYSAPDIATSGNLETTMKLLFLVMSAATGLNAATYAFSGQMQTYEFPANNSAKFSTFVAKVTIDETQIQSRGACAGSGIGSVGASFKLPANALEFTLTFTDGAKRTIGLWRCRNHLLQWC